jgi:hypothetical protein
MLGGYKRAASPNNVTQGFKIAGIVVECDKSAAVARADRQAASQVRDSAGDKTRIRIHHAQ